MKIYRRGDISALGVQDECNRPLWGYDFLPCMAETIYYILLFSQLIILIVEIISVINGIIPKILQNLVSIIRRALLKDSIVPLSILSS